MKYEPVIGFEVHLQPKTKSKMFCSCSARYFGEKPNSHVCPVCLGLPGALPVPNKTAFDSTILLALALNCNINENTRFDRKNYFYHDLPKGYQISQFDRPIGENGYIEFDLGKDSKRIRIKRVHLEEDTAKTIREGGTTLVDFNKSGIALIEIVTEPDFENIEEVDKFAKRLRQIVRYLDVSDADMEKGQMRYELNMSMRLLGQKKLPEYKVEVKNIGSISVLQKVIQREIVRQTGLLENDQTPQQETRGLSGMSGDTKSMRLKETSDDYRYFPEPDIPPIMVDKKWLEEIRSKIIELPQGKKHRYIAEYGLAPDSAETLVSSIPRYKFFEECMLIITDPKDKKELAPEIAKWMIGELAALLKRYGQKFAQIKLDASDLVELSAAFLHGRITGQAAKRALEIAFTTGKSIEKVINEERLGVMNDVVEILKLVNEVLEKNPDAITNLKKNPNAMKYLVGQVMRLSSGRANPKTIENELLKMLRLN